MKLVLLLLLAGVSQEDEALQAIESWSDRFALDRPWVETMRPERGALAHVVGRLKSASQEVRAGVYRDLSRLLSLDASSENGRAAIVACRPEQAAAYAKHFGTDVFALWKRLLVPGAEEPPWGKSLKEWYYSRADGTAQAFDVRFPPKVDGLDRYPMIVVLKGGTRVAPSREHPFIQIRPSTRGVWGPCSLPGWDAVQAVRQMKRAYPVDPDRVYLVGFSAGASAAMHVSGRHADEFAAVMPMVAFGTGVPLFNFRNLPLAIHHGSHDWTSAVCNVRAQVKRLRELKNPFTYVEYEGVGHSVPRPHEPLVKWMLDQKRDPCPTSVAVECEAPEWGRSYWIRILEFGDPHQVARIEASIEGDAVKVVPKNVHRFSLDLARIRTKSKVASLEIQGKRLPLGDADTVRVVAGALESEVPAGKGRPYQAGAAANLYQGEPLLLVYGSAGGERKRLQELAGKLSRYGGSQFSPQRSRFPVVADTELTDVQEAHCNLVLIGRPEENRVTGRLLPDLPLAVQGGVLKVGKRKDLSLRGRVLSVLARHPNHPSRLVYVIAPFVEGEAFDRFVREMPQRSLVGSDGFDRLSQGDLVVQTVEGTICRQMQVDKSWVWVEPPGEDRPLPPRFRGRAEVASALTDLMRKDGVADLGLWWGPADRGMWGTDFNFLKRYDPATFTEVDFRVRRGAIETMIGGATGRELREIWQRWGKNRELLFSPGVDVEKLEDEKRYRVRIPMDLYIKLGQRRKSLDDPAFGPPITPEQFRKALFP